MIYLMINKIDKLNWQILKIIFLDSVEETYKVKGITDTYLPSFFLKSPFNNVNGALFFWTKTSFKVNIHNQIASI